MGAGGRQLSELGSLNTVFFQLFLWTPDDPVVILQLSELSRIPLSRRHARTGTNADPTGRTPMSALADFREATNLRLGTVTLDVVEPPFVAGFEIPGIRGPRSSLVGCITKAAGGLDVPVGLLGISVPFQGRFLGVDARGRWLLRFSVDVPSPGRLMGFNVERVRGDLTVALASMPPRTDLRTCGDEAGQYFVELSLVAADDRDDSFDHGEPVPNAMTVWVTGVTPTRALITGLGGPGGITAPPPRPWPQVAAITFNTGCVASARLTPSVSGRIWLDSSILRDHVGFSVTVAAEGLDPPRPLDSNAAIYGREVSFVVRLPPDLTGRVRVTAYTNDREQVRSVELNVGANGRFGCRPPFQIGLYEARLVGCEAYDCDWIALSDRGSLIGRDKGVAALYLLGQARLELVGRSLGERAILRAINNSNLALGVLDPVGDVSGSFLYRGDTEGEALQVIPEADLVALNDAGAAVGLTVSDDHPTPVIWSDGKLSKLDVAGLTVLPQAIDGGGRVFGVVVDQGDFSRIVMIDSDGLHELAKLPGQILRVRANDAGIVAGMFSLGKLLRGFVLAEEEVIQIEPSIKGNLAVTSINDQGTVVGTYYGDDNMAAYGFRYDADSGFKLLDNLIVGGVFHIEEAIDINNLGQLLVKTSADGKPSYALLNPAQTFIA